VTASPQLLHQLSTKITFNHKVIPYECHAMVTKFLQLLQGEVIGVYKIVLTDEYNSIPVNEKKFKKLQNYTLLYEVYFTKSMDIKQTIQLLAPIPHCTPISSTLPPSVYHLARDDKTVILPPNTIVNNNKTESSINRNIKN